MRKQFAPRFYSGLGAARALYATLIAGQTEGLDHFMSELEGASDAPWCALLLVRALEQEKANRLPEPLASALIALMERASEATKPLWWDREVERAENESRG